MTQKKEDTQSNPDEIAIGATIIQKLSTLKPYSSMSFVLGNDGYNAVEELIKITEENMGKNMHKLKKTALETLTHILHTPPGDPININFTEDELKALEKVADLVNK